MIQAEIFHRHDREAVRYEASDGQIGIVLQSSEMEVGKSRGATSKYRYAPGEMFFTPHRRGLWLCGHDALFMLVTLSRSAIDSVFNSRSFSMLRCRKHLKDPRLSGLLSSLHSESAAGFPSGRLYLDSIELAIASVLATTVPAPGSTAGAARGLAPYKLRRITEYIREKLDADISLSELSAVVDLSQSHFTQMFRASTGLTPCRFVLRARLERSRELLLDSDQEVLNVAMQCGFKTSQHFAKTFRQQWQMSPTQFRHYHQKI